METENNLREITVILEEAKKRGASDIHLAPGMQILFRIDGKLEKMSEEKVRPFEIEALAGPMLSEEQQEVLEEEGELDFAYSIPGFSRLRINVFRQRGTYAMAIRLLSAEIPTPEQIGLPKEVVELTAKKRGLVLVTGSAGSGKSTTLAAMISQIAKNYEKSIITLEDPIEYLHQHSKSMVLQREIGYDSMSYPHALRAALRQDPDVILVGEMRDTETISIALSAAENGHLVFSTLHTNNTEASIERLVEVFPPFQQQQIRVQLSSVLEGVISQQLLPIQNSAGRVAAFEVMLANQTIRDLIREGKYHQIPAVIQSNRKAGMIAMDDAIYDLYMKSYINSETAISFAQDSASMRQKVQLF